MSLAHAALLGVLSVVYFGVLAAGFGAVIVFSRREDRRLRLTTVIAFYFSGIVAYIALVWIAWAKL